MSRFGLGRLGRYVAGRIERWLPNPFVFAVILTYIVFLGGRRAVENRSPAQMLSYWNEGFWGSSISACRWS